MSIEGICLLVWIGFMLLGLACAFVVLLWSIRNRQFADQDRARYLPLESRIPPEDSPPPATSESEPLPQERGKHHVP